MKKVKYGSFEEYDNNPYGRTDIGNIGGTTDKKFIRMDNKMFRPLFKAKMKENSYVTYIDDFIKDYIDKDGNIPLKYISCLFKKQRTVMGSNDNIKRDVMGSRLANLFGVPTVYNDIVEYEYETYLLSVDFVKTGQEVEVFADTYDKVPIDDFSTFQDWENYLNVKIGSIFAFSNGQEKGTSEHQAETKKKFVSDFVSHYIFRNLILDDSDFKPRNVNYITEINNEGVKDIKLAPANDFEFAMTYRRKTLMKDNISKNMKYLYENYNKETCEFMDRLKRVLYKTGELNNSKIHKIFTDVEKDAEYVTMLEGRLLENIETLVNSYEHEKRENAKQVALGD